MRRCSSIVVALVMLAVVCATPAHGQPDMDSECSYSLSREARDVLDLHFGPLLSEAAAAAGLRGRRDIDTLQSVLLKPHCPLSHVNDLLRPHELARVTRARRGRYQCVLCAQARSERRKDERDGNGDGDDYTDDDNELRTFRSIEALDQHMDVEHRSARSNATGAVCLASYCNMLRCPSSLRAMARIGQCHRDQLKRLQMQCEQLALRCFDSAAGDGAGTLAQELFRQRFCAPLSMSRCASGRLEPHVKPPFRLLGMSVVRAVFSLWGVVSLTCFMVTVYFAGRTVSTEKSFASRRRPAALATSASSATASSQAHRGGDAPDWRKRVARALTRCWAALERRRPGAPESLPLFGQVKSE